MKQQWKHNKSWRSQCKGQMNLGLPLTYIYVYMHITYITYIYIYITYVYSYVYNQRSKYSRQKPDDKHLSLHSSNNVKDQVSQRTKLQVTLQFCTFQFLWYLVAWEETEVSKLNGSNHSANRIYS
jgi:hypothetical protein